MIVQHTLSLGELSQGQEQRLGQVAGPALDAVPLGDRLQLGGVAPDEDRIGNHAAAPVEEARAGRQLLEAGPLARAVEAIRAARRPLIISGGGSSSLNGRASSAG